MSVAGGLADAPAGYLNFGSYGPPTPAVEAAVGRLVGAAAAGEPAAGLHAEDARAIAAVSRLSGFPAASIVLQPSTSAGLVQVASGMPAGEVLVAPGEFPANRYPWWRAEAAGGARVRDLPGAALDPVTPDRVLAALTPETTALSVSAVDFRTGFRADLAGLRDVLGDRLLIVDGIQGFGVIEADWTLADALAVGGQKWLRAGWGTGFLAFSDRGLERIRPAASSWTGVRDAGVYDGAEHAALPGAAAFQITNGSPFASGALAAALGELELAGLPAVVDAVAERAAELDARLAIAGVPVRSPRAAADRAGIVVAGVADAAASVARLAEAGIAATAHDGDRVRLSVHAATTSATLEAAVAVLAAER